MRASALVAVLLPLVVSCVSSGQAQVRAVPNPESQILMEFVLAHYSEAELAQVRSLSLERIIADSDAVLEVLGGATSPGQPFVYDLPNYGGEGVRGSQQQEVTHLDMIPTMVDSGRQAVDMTVRFTVRTSEREAGFERHLSVDSGTLRWLETGLVTSEGEALVVLLQPTILQSKAALAEVLARRAQNVPTLPP